MNSTVRVKICGITSEADGVAVARLGADAVGLNFYSQSPRCVRADVAQRILRELPPFLCAVGLFVDTPLPEMKEQAARAGRISILQSYGEPRPTDDPFPFLLIPSFNIRDESSLREMDDHIQRCRALGRAPAAVLVDASVPGQYGGTGHVAPWRLLAGVEWSVPLILAGGLTPENVAEAIRVVRPYGVDVASGVESAQGRKDAEKVRRFIANAREAAAQLA